MRNAFSMVAVATAFLIATSVATAAPKAGNLHGAGAAAGPGVEMGAGGAGAGAADPLFAILDTDGDGVISAKELHKAVAALKELDANHDGGITWDEVLAASATASQLRMGQGDASSGNGAGQAGGGGFGGEGSQAMGRFMQYDKNHDGKLTSDELPPQMAALLRDADLNGDHAIDARELKIAVEKMGERMKAGMAGAMNGPQGPGVAGRMPGGNPAGGAGGGKGP